MCIFVYSVVITDYMKGTFLIAARHATLFFPQRTHADKFQHAKGSVVQSLFRVETKAGYVFVCSLRDLLFILFWEEWTKLSWRNVAKMLSLCSFISIYKWFPMTNIFKYYRFNNILSNLYAHINSSFCMYFHSSILFKIIPFFKAYYDS